MAMSFLPVVGADATLAAALEFIESFDDSSVDLHRDPIVCGAGSRPIGPARGGPVKKSNALVPKRLRDKKRREMAALSEEAAVLEARLAHLQQRATCAANTGASIGSCSGDDAALVARVAGAMRASVAAVNKRQGVASWFDVAVEEARERKQSEELNVELRLALEGLAKLANSLRKLLRGHAAGQSVASALEKFQQRYSEQAIASPLDDLITDLQLQIVNQYFDIDTVFQPSEASSVLAEMQASHNASGQVVVELSTTITVACSLQDAVRMLAAGLMAKESRGQKTFLDKRAHGDEVEKRCTVDLQAAEALQGAVFMRMLDECDRFLVLWGGGVTPICGAAQIREKSWVTLTHQDDVLVSDARQTSQGVLDEWSLRTQMDLQFIQSVILEEAAKTNATMVTQV